MEMALSYNRSLALYTILLISPFINIVNHNLSSTPIFIILGAVFLISLLDLKKLNNYKEHYFFILVILYAAFLYILTLLSFRKGTVDIILFFTAPVFLYLYYSSIFDLKYFFRKYYQKILKYYIIIIFLSIVVDSIILYIIGDVSLQLMYSETAFSYHTRPHGITGNATANSVLIIFFYSLLLSTNSNKKGLYFCLITSSVFFQGSGLGFLVYGALVFFIARRTRNGKIFAFAILPLIILSMFFIPVAEKLSPQYFSSMFNEFLKQYDSFISSISKASDFVFGGVVGGIDFLPIFLTSSMGILYALTVFAFFFYLIIKTKFYYDTVALFLMVLGTLHYPILFYTLSAFFFPLFIFKIINHKLLYLES